MYDNIEIKIKQKNDKNRKQSYLHDDLKIKIINGVGKPTRYNRSSSSNNNNDDNNKYTYYYYYNYYNNNSKILLIIAN